MIPTSDVIPVVPDLAPTCEMPKKDDITEEGFGYFRGAWFLGRVLFSDAERAVAEEAAVIDWIDKIAASAAEFELLTKSIENGYFDDLDEPLLSRSKEAGGEVLLQELDDSPFFGLEIGVAGLTCALSSIQCLTAASCRAHVDRHSWSNCPVVFFAAPDWRMRILADLVRDAGCGVEEDREMLKIYAPSIRHTNGLAKSILDQRGLFRRNPQARKRIPWRKPSEQFEMDLFPDEG